MGGRPPIDAELVRALVARQFPTFASSTVEYLDEGWDKIVFEVGASWLFRFPKPCRYWEKSNTKRSV
ncbi:MAG TPA: hypothetical protein VFF73_31510 [Planctomycetota bacterium]|nr:hypothetical protein [Planctomycetota bacterium]